MPTTDGCSCGTPMVMKTTDAPEFLECPHCDKECKRRDCQSCARLMVKDRRP